MDNLNEKEIEFEISPKFNLLYEMGMPTGRKIRNSLAVCSLFIVASVVLIINQSKLEFANTIIIADFTMLQILKFIAIVIILFTFIRAMICTIVQSLTYKHMTYTFYPKFMVYEDDFLNQHKKTIQYENIKEVEIRRTVWDRILGFGIIVIYTNAENSRKNGMVLYGIKNVREVYDKIEALVHSSKEEAAVKSVERKEEISEDSKPAENENSFIEDMASKVEK